MIRKHLVVINNHINCRNFMIVKVQGITLVTFFQCQINLSYPLERVTVDGILDQFEVSGEVHSRSLYRYIVRDINVLNNLNLICFQLSMVIRFASKINLMALLSVFGSAQSNPITRKDCKLELYSITVITSNRETFSFGHL